MAKVLGKIQIIPVLPADSKQKKRTVSEVLDVEWKDAPKAERALACKKTVEKWARDKYRGQSVTVDPGTIRERGDDGLGQLFVDGAKYADFASRILRPAPVAAASLFGGPSS